MAAPFTTRKLLRILVIATLLGIGIVLLADSVATHVPGTPNVHETVVFRARVGIALFVAAAVAAFVTRR